MAVVDSDSVQLCQQLLDGIGARHRQGHQRASRGQSRGRLAVVVATELFELVFETLRDLAKVVEVGPASTGGAMAQDLKGSNGEFATCFQELEHVPSQGDGCDGFHDYASRLRVALGLLAVSAGGLCVLIEKKEVGESKMSNSSLPRFGVIPMVIWSRERVIGTLLVGPARPGEASCLVPDRASVHRLGFATGSERACRVAGEL